MPQYLIPMAYDCYIDTTLPRGKITSMWQVYYRRLGSLLTERSPMAKHENDKTREIAAFVHGIHVESGNQSPPDGSPAVHIVHLTIDGETMEGGPFSINVGIAGGVLKDVASKIL